MAYNTKYRILQNTQSGNNTVLDLLKDDYAGAVINYEATFVNLQYIPQSDDPFEPIYASELAVGIDVTNNAANMPDFTELDDRKYWVRYYQGGVLKWQGWALSDNVQYLFSTGFKELRFNCICGLGMLESIDFTTTVTTYKATIWQFFLDAITKLNYPIAPNIVDFTSIYSSAMSNRIDSPQSTPWTQSYMSVNNFVRPALDADGNFSNEITCLNALRDILISWGCRLFMANGEWNIVQVNQAANSTRYFTRYDGSGDYLEDGTVTRFINIPDDAIFLQNTQLKIYKKGFNNFLSNKKIEYADNLLFNANLKKLTAGDADYWAEFVSGTGYTAIRENQDRGVNAFILAQGNNITTGFAQITSTTPMPISVNNSPKVQFRVYFTSGDTNISGNLHPTCIMKLIIAGATQNVFLNNDNEWEVLSLGANDYYQVEGKKSGTLVNLEEIPPATIDGTLSFAVYVGGTVATQSAIVIGEFEVTYEAAFVGVKLEAKITDTNTYRKQIEFPHGYNQNRTNIVTVTEQPAFLGAITDVDGKPMYGWYMQERFGVDNYFCLAELMFQNYINMLRQNIINIDSTIEGVIEATDILEFDDTDPAQISVSGKKYIIGSTIFNRVKKEMQGTLLQIDNTHQEATVTVTYDNGIGSGIGLQMSTGAISSAAACALTTYPNEVYSTQFIPVVGDIIYSDADLTQPWQGNTIWWKVFIPYYNTTRSYRINASGVITNVSTC